MEQSACIYRFRFQNSRVGRRKIRMCSGCSITQHPSVAYGSDIREHTHLVPPGRQHASVGNRSGSKS